MKFKWSLFVILLLALSCHTLKQNPDTYITAVEVKAPKLAVFISIDQMRYEYLERFNSQFEHGFRRLLDEGAVLANTKYQHAITGTAPGHATLSTGSHPATHGIMANNYYTPGQEGLAYAVTDTATQLLGITSDKRIYGSSPFNLLVPALGDWLKDNHPGAKVYSVAFKDRSATLMGGLKADRAFWFDQPSTRMVSSSYYTGAFPQWSEYYIGKEIFKSAIERGWHKLKKEEEYSASREDDFPQELGIQKTTFPHTLHTFMPPASTASYEARKGMLLWNTPFGDAYTLEFAKAIIENEDLGSDDIQDLLFVGCSVADKIGHHYGPFSQEIQDYYLRLDIYLGNFFTYLDEKIGRENYYVSLSADHGVLPLPEELVRRGVEARRISRAQFDEDVQFVQENIKKELGLQNDFVLVSSYQGIGLDYTEAKQLGISINQLQDSFAKAFSAIPYVDEVYTTKELQDGSNKESISYFKNNYRPDRGVEIKVKFAEHALIGAWSTGTSHGTIYEYDTHVPAIFMGPQIKAGTYTQKAGVVDIAPTMARILNIKIPTFIDGRPLDYILQAEQPTEEKENLEE